MNNATTNPAADLSTLDLVILTHDLSLAHAAAKPGSRDQLHARKCWDQVRVELASRGIAC